MTDTPTQTEDRYAGRCETARKMLNLSLVHPAIRRSITSPALLDVLVTIFGSRKRVVWFVITSWWQWQRVELWFFWQSKVLRRDVPGLGEDFK